MEKYAPYAAGSPPAVVLGFSLYHAVLNVTGTGWEWLAALIAFVGVVGMMTTEIYSYRKVAQAIALKEWGAFALMLAGALTCSGLIVFAVYNGANSKSLISSVVVAVIMYAAVGANAYFQEREKLQERTLKEKKVQASLERARARQMEAEAVRPKPEQNEQKHEQHERLDHVRLSAVREYLKANPGAKVRDVCRDCKISSTDTASRYMKAAK